MGAIDTRYASPTKPIANIHSVTVESTPANGKLAVPVRLKTPAAITYNVKTMKPNKRIPNNFFLRLKSLNLTRILSCPLVSF